VWQAILFLWLYSGILRNLLPQLDYVLYILPFLISFLYFILGRSRQESSEKSREKMFLFLLVILIFQIMHYFSHSIELHGLFTGLILYGLAPTIIFLGSNSAPTELVQPLIRSIGIAIPINLAVVFLQVISNLKFFRHSPLTGGPSLTTDGSVLRAFGTFTAPVGFATFLSVASVIVIYQFKFENNLKRFSQLFQLGLLYLLSGSRTVYINLVFIILVLVFLKRKSSRNHELSRGMGLFIGTGITIGLAFVLLKFRYSWVLDSFVNRINTASAQENSLNRILNQSFGWFKYLGDSLWGHGLGSYSTVSIGFAADRSAWIENDLTKNIAEAGTLMGITIIALRWAWPFVIHAKVKNSQTEKPDFVYLLLAASFLNLTIGALTGQGSVSLQVWICLSVCNNLTSNQSIKQKGSNST